MASSKAFLYLMQVVTIGTFIVAFVSLFSVFSPGTWQIGSLFRTLGAFKNFFSYFAYMVMAMVGMGGMGVFRMTSVVYIQAYDKILEPVLFQYLNVIFHMTDDQGALIRYTSYDDVMGSIFGHLQGQFFTIVSEIYFMLFLICIIIAVLYMLIFVVRGDIKFSLYSSLSLVVPVILAVFPSLIKNILYMVSVPPEAYVPFFDQYFPATDLLNPEIRESTLSFENFFTNPGVWLAFFIYLYLEASFQTSYVARVISPSIERTRRLENQLAVLGEQSRVLEEEREELQRQKVSLASSSSGERLTIKSFFSGAGIDAIRELVERRERQREREQLEEVSSDTRRLDTYVRRLMEVDKEARRSLTAAGSSPSTKGMVLSTFTNMGIRLGALFLLVFVASNPGLVFSVFRMPAIVINSVEFTSLETIITVLVPVALLFPVVAFGIRTYKRYQLTVYNLRRQEESALLKRLSEIRAIEEEETFEAEQQKDIAPGATVSPK